MPNPSQSTFESCTFVAHQDSQEEVIVRLEASGSHIPIVVRPAVHQIGTASTENGKKLDYSVTTYIKNAVTLESVWGDLTDDQQSHVAEQVASAIKNLHSINLLDEKARQFVKPGSHAIPEAAGPLGGPELGFFSNVSDLVRGLVASQDGFEQVTLTSTDDGGLRFETQFDDIPSVSMSEKDMFALQEAIVLCHNDLEPRNILVRAENLAVHYKVVAIIDWELAGFFPFVFESFYKDLALGNANLDFPWYRLFKDQTAQFIPKPLPGVQESLLRALDMVLKARARASTRNVGKLIQRKWIEREQLVQSDEISLRWVRNAEVASPTSPSPDAPLPVGSSAATLEFAAAQKKARDAGDHSWRLLAADGSTVLHP
ncbi:hypothetical protein ATEIFO6365_0009006600 [Aspergillus terreus]|uniref:Aminoglycoside phosphotransferase domain-containing protein n=1 Tax=Aspergillus terreus TaxID=33178 RepID=A0A5M3Z761_ASPTE|nr:hypothetical protein ATETN484_0011006600 [Aspergillus terreus]GFF18703.1 hypothetical protein ATEIFO6365_0009006600 [Aspergillus terreus]